MPAQTKFLKEIIGNLPSIQITDLGAAPIDGEPPYKPLLESGIAEVTCFEPQKDQFEKLAAEENPRARYLPHAVGDGEEHTLHICKAPGMASFLEPDMEILSHFHGFPDWGTVVRKERIKTLRLDDIPEVRDTHYLKMDIQGFELTVLQNAPKVLENAVAVQTEVNFIPLYKGQPLFAEIDQQLREAGFVLHTFEKIHKRTFQPARANNSIYEGINQVMWTDAHYFRRFTDFPGLSSESLLRIATIAHDVHASFDLALLALRHHDEKFGTSHQQAYMGHFAQSQAGQTFSRKPI